MALRYCVGSDLFRKIEFVDLESKCACTMLQYLGIGFLPAAWFLFSLEYSGNSRKSLFRLELFLFSFSALIFLVVNTNRLYWLYYTDYFLDNSNPFPIIIYEHGPLCWIYYSHSFFLVLAALFFFCEQFLNSNFPFKSQAGICLIKGSLTLLGNMLYMGKVSPFSLTGPTPFLFSIPGMIIFWSTMRHEFLNLVPIARNNVIECMKDGYMVVDEESCVIDISYVIDINPVAF